VPEILKRDYDIGFLTYYVGIIEQLTKTDEAKAVKLIQNIATLIKEQKIPITGNTTLVDNNLTSLTLRNNFNNKFIDCLLYLVYENTFIFNTFIEQFYNEEKLDEDKKEKRFDFENDNYAKFETKIKKYYEEKQQARWQSLNSMLHKYEINDDKLEGKEDSELETAFYKTVYLKTLLENDKNKKHTTQKVNIKDKTQIILKYLAEILGINKDECENGGAYFTVRYNDRDKAEKDITEDDLYTVSQYCIGDDKLEMPLTDENSIVFDSYRGIKRKNSRKPTSLTELILKKCECQGNHNNIQDCNCKGRYISSEIEKYYSDEEITINENKLETSNTFDHKYNNLLFLRIADIKEDKEYRKILEKFIDEIVEKGKLPKTFKHYKEFVKQPKTSIERLERLKRLCRNDEKIIEKVDKYINTIQENDLIKIQYFSEIADFPLNVREKFMKSIKKAIENADDDKEIIRNIKDVLLKFKRKEIYRSYPVAVIGFYKCRLEVEEEKQCSKYEEGTCKGLHERFDPKRVRFLLLLRDEIGKFVERHLRNDSFSAYVGSEKRDIEFRSPDHNYYNNLADLSFALQDNDMDKVNFIYDLAFYKKEIRDLLEQKKLNDFDNDEQINLELEIKKYAKFILEPTSFDNSDFNDITTNLEISFPKFIFREIMYEYIRNAAFWIRRPFPIPENILPKLLLS